MTVCDKCGEDKEDGEEVMVSPGRDYPGVGGGIVPPEYAFVCEECREEERQRYEEQEQKA